MFEQTKALCDRFLEMGIPGLDAYYEHCNHHCSTAELEQQFAKTPLEFEPGASWLYGLSHDVLAALVEQLSGQKFEDYVREYIFQPLGMENSDFMHSVEDWEGFARQYRYDSETKQYDLWWDNTYRPAKGYASGGAGCVSTVEDCSKFLEALRKTTANALWLRYDKGVRFGNVSTTISKI